MIVEIWDWERFNFNHAVEKAKVRWFRSGGTICYDESTDLFKYWLSQCKEFEIIATVDVVLIIDVCCTPDALSLGPTKFTKD